LIAYAVPVDNRYILMNQNQISQLVRLGKSAISLGKSAVSLGKISGFTGKISGFTGKISD
jgi:hypothetical protein